MILLSTSGTSLIYNSRNSDAVYVACFRNYAATIEHVVGRHHRVAVIGAGSRTEFRREDQLCCAWIAKGLINAGYIPEDFRTTNIVNKSGDESQECCKNGNSAKYLIKTNQVRDLEFILSHINDLPLVVMLKHGELIATQVTDQLSLSYMNEEKAYGN